MFDVSPLLAHPRLAKVQVYQPGKPIEELERELGIRGAVKLASNENAFGPSPRALRAAARALSTVNRYPDGGAFYLKRGLAKAFGIGPERIVVGNGSDELIVMAVRAFLSGAGEILTATPTFLVYRIAAAVQGGGAVEVPMKNDRYDLERMADAVTPKTKIVFIANPDNPVGTYVTHAELGRFIGRLPGSCMVFLDEAYYEFARARRDYPRSFDFLDRPNVIVSRTFSKAYGLSGLRVGYAFTSPEVAAAMDRVREPFNVNSVAQAAALAALGDRRFLARVLKGTEAGKKKITAALRHLGVSYVESATNFVLARFGDDAAWIYEELLRSGVIVRSMKGWGLAQHLRITVGTPAENNLFIRKLKTVLNRIRRKTR